MISKLTAKEVDEKFDNGEELDDFFTEELDPETYLPKTGAEKDGNDGG